MRVPATLDAPLRRLARPLAWAGCLVPLAWIVFDAFTDRLGADPIRALTLRTGFTTLTLLMVTLAVTPLRKLSGWNPLIQLRRTFGLFAFFYAVIHFSIYLVDQGFALPFIVEDVAKRPYITVGFTAFLLLIPLAATSTQRAIRRLGKRWVQLHRLIYLAAALGVVHFYWLVKRDVRPPLIFAAVLLGLLLFRAPLLFGRTRPAGKKRVSSSRDPARPRRAPTAGD